MSITNITFRWILFPLVWLGGMLHSFAQNLVPNPSFETYTYCPDFYNIGEPLPCTPWQNVPIGTSDYFNACSNPSIVGVPTNLFGYQEAHTGEAYAGCYWGNEYLQVQLLCPLIENLLYNISFYISLAELTCGTANIGVYFSTTPPPPPGNPPYNLNVIPQFESNLGFVSDYLNWVLISGTFIAVGGEEWITIGNFYPPSETPTDPGCSIFPLGYYYVDDVSLTPSIPYNELGLELGEPVITCASYEIDPGITGVDYHWSDGSTGSTLIVTESGTYALTITSGCNSPGIDSVNVFFDGVSEGVDLGPAEVTICNGDSYTISLNPDIGDYLWQDGSTDPDYSITTPGLYQVSFDDGCDVTTDEINVLVMDIPAPFSLGGEAYLCPEDEINFSLDPSLGDFLWQNNSTSPDYTIYISGIYALTISNMCGEFSDEIEVFDLVPPEINLGADLITFCAGQILDIDLNPDLGDFLWQDGSIMSSYSISIPGIYAVTVTNACGTSSDEVEAILVDVPIFELLPDQSLCPGQTITLDGSGVEGNYFWQDSSATSTLLVSQEGTYSLTITNQCGTGSDSITVNYIDSLTSPDLGPDVSLCPGDTVILYAGVPGATYLWQDLSTADSLVVMLAGTYSLQIANLCSTTSDTVAVTIDTNPPDVELPAVIDLCASDTVVLNAGISGVQYAWSDGTQLSSIAVLDPGWYSITVSNACGTDVDTVVIVDAGPAPSVSLSADLFICPGEVILLSPVSSDVLSWLWQDGSTGSTYNVSSPGMVTIQVSNNCGVDVDTMVVSLLPSTPILYLGADTSLCPGEILTFSVNLPGVDIIWPDGSTSPDYNVTNAGLVYATISDLCGSSSDSLEVILLPPPPILDLGIDQSLCPGETITLSPGISDVVYLWQDGSTSPAFYATVPGLIILSVTNACGVSMDTLEIIEDTDGPEVDLGEDVLGCEGDVVTLSSGIFGVNYLWQDGSTQPYFSTAVSGTYILQVSNACGVDADTVIVDIIGHIPAPSLGPDTILCEGSLLQLLSNVDAETFIQWQDGSTLPIFVVSSAGQYTLTASNHCGDAADTIVITYESAPVPFDLGPDTVLCPGESFLLHAPATSAIITWQDGSHGYSTVADQELTYSLQLSNLCGQVSDDLYVSIDDRVPVLDIDQEIPWCRDDIITLDATQVFDATYLWSTGSTLPLIQVNTPGLYAVNVTTICQSIQQEIEVVSDDNCNHDLYIPNIFSPNGDQVNDVFRLFIGSGLDVVFMSCSIFDRWGNNVFDSRELNFAWDGSFKGSPLMPGVYGCRISLNYLSRGKTKYQVFIKDVTLVR